VAESRFPCKPRVLIGLAAAEGLTSEEFSERVADWHREVALDVRGRGYWTRTGINICGTEQLFNDTVGAYFPEPINPLGGFATIDLEEYHATAAAFDVLIDTAAKVVGKLTDIVDPRRSFVMAGLVNLVQGGEGPFAMILMCTNKADVELRAAHSWWCSFGEEIYKHSTGRLLGYHQVQGDPELTELVAKRCGLTPSSFNMGDLGYIPSVADFVAATAASDGLSADPGPPVNQRDAFVSFRGAVGSFCKMMSP
jgi:hypothetical protein